MNDHELAADLATQAGKLLLDVRARYLLQGRLPQRTDQWIEWRSERAHV